MPLNEPISDQNRTLSDLTSTTSRAATTLLLILLIGAVAGYLLPWAIAPSGPMTLNAFDLAEWLSLHPPQHHTSPPLLATLLLRLQLLIVCLMFSAVSANTSWKFVSAIVIILLALGQLPPPEFVFDPGNLNYRQQFALALASLLASLLLLRVRRARLLSAILVILPCAGVLSAIAGLSQAYDVYASLQAGTAIGLGLWILVANYIGIFLAAVLTHFKRPPQS